MSGVLLLNSIWMMSKCVRRHVLSDVFFTFFFVFGCLGYGLHAIASQMLVAGDNWFVAWSVENSFFFFNLPAMRGNSSGFDFACNLKWLND